MMNERIEKLVRQADACYIPRYDMWQMDTETMEKFAELIVRQCARVGERYADGNYEVFNQILEHFGLEEE